MAVCNLFNVFDDKRHSGNFMLFSQYVEDITHNFTEGTNHKVVPSRFVALHIGDRYKNIVKQSEDESLNIAVPRYFQNYFENACAYIRNSADKLADSDSGETYTSWNADISRNLFWNSMFANWDYNEMLDEYILSDTADNSLLSIDENNIVPQVKYWGDINMQSYNEHNGMGYNELYCYIPSNANLYKCAISGKVNMNGIDNDKATIEGYDSNANISLSPSIERYPNSYCFDSYYETGFEDTLGLIIDDKTTSYDIDTIVVLYDVLVLGDDGKWTYKHQYIPMGMYICGHFDENGDLTNSIKKYVTVTDEIGTSYGLRICTRFTVSPYGAIMQETELNTDSDNYASLCQVMTGMAENLNKMFEITNSTVNNIQLCKDELSILKNNRTNVPYIKTINGDDYWFVNGKLVSKVIVDVEEATKDETDDKFNENETIPPSDTIIFETASCCEVSKLFGYDDCSIC
jgi:hypothetical protein